MIGDFLDRVISVFSPATALERTQYRRAYLQERKYQGAQITKTDPRWTPQNTSADSEVLPDLPRLRARSRDLMRNNPWANSIVDSFIKNVVGPRGIRPQIKGAKANLIEKYLLEQFRRIDVTGMMSFWGIQKLAFRHLLIDGECFIRVVYEGRTADGHPRFLKLQIIEPDQIWSNRSMTDSGNEVRAGIEIDKSTGRHMSYFVNYHPGDYGMTIRFEEKRVYADDMIHLFVRTRANQTRGVPLFAPIVNTLKDRGEYLYTESVKQRVAACLAVLIKKNSHPRPAQDDDGDKITNLSPGMVGYLKPGEDIAVVDGRKTDGNFVPFNQTMDRASAAGTGLSYATVSKDYSQTNFSGERTSLLAEHATYEEWQGFLEEYLCERVVDEALELRYLQGEREMPQDIQRVWQSKGFDWVDPEKEVKAAILAIKYNLDTKAAVIARRGGDLNEVLEQREKETQLEKEKGIYVADPKADHADTGATADDSSKSADTASVVGRKN